MATKHASATAKPAWTLLCVDKRVLAEGSRGALRDAPVRPLKQRSRRSGSSAGFSAAPFRDTKFEWFDRPDSRGIVAATYRSSVILTVRSRQKHLACERVAYQYGPDWLPCTGGPGYRPRGRRRFRSVHHLALDHTRCRIRGLRFHARAPPQLPVWPFSTVSEAHSRACIRSGVGAV